MVLSSGAAQQQELIVGLENLLRLCENELAQFGGRRAVGGFLEDAAAHRMFDALDLRADRGLAQAEQLGGLGNAAGLRDADNRAHDLGWNAGMLITAMHVTFSFDMRHPRAKCGERVRDAKVIDRPRLPRAETFLRIA